ncbi:ABC transporter substrate-binding protein [Thermoanaerobacterium thermosaccharolyticum]|uniref:ABC transporter substrate-binding protein n=1 Tax=Thermoanaerobacterium thermosaccharolyticum TaxID=1517 RepID=UPI00211B15CD|nr:ABC transporter substrate-binding protein [Thermoanaerobacterium thermosaccharolyticum]
MGIKNKIMTSLVSLILVLILIAGCSSNGNSTATNSTSKNEPVTITYSSGKDSTPATQKLIEAFEQKYPNIKVKVQELPNSTDDQHNSYVTALSAGDSSIDVLAMDIIWTPEFAAANWLLPLDDKFTQEMRDKFLPGPVEAVTYDGHIWAVPRFTDAGVLYYRKDIISTPPKTWEELIQMAKDNVGKGGTKYGIVFQGNQYEGLVCDALEVIGSNGGNVLEGDKVTINTPQTVAGLQYLLDLTKIAPPGVTTYQEEDARNVFQQGEAIFMRNWPYAWSLVNGDDSPIKDKVGIAPIPKGKDSQAGTPALGGTLA